MDALHRQTDTWLANGLAGGLRPGLNDRIAWFRGLKAICEIAFFVAQSPHRHAAVLVEAVDACLLDLWAGGRLLALARHNLQHANLFLPLLLSCQMRLQLDERCKADIRKV